MTTTWRRSAGLALVMVAGAAMAACSGMKRAAAEPAAQRPTEPAAVLPAPPPQVIAAAEQAFIELDLQPTSAEATSRGGCALARTPAGEVVTVTATTAAPAESWVRIHIQPADVDDTIGSHLLESIAAHLSVGASAAAR